MRQKNYIFGTECCGDSDFAIWSGKVCVIAHLFYLEKLGYFWRFLNEMDERIMVMVITSNRDVQAEMCSLIRDNKKNNISVRMKPNRGRDISAFLIAGKDIFYKYQYICVVHDKKAKEQDYEEDVDLWIENLWGNMIASTGYIHHVLSAFESDSGLGLLVSPKPIGQRINALYSDCWYRDYENTVALAKKLGLRRQISRDSQEMSIGGVFWCRQEALLKLIDFGWEYSDFEEEPLQIDCELNHAVERIMPYVAQDAGYDTGVVMTQEYAAKSMEIMVEALKKGFGFLNRNFSIGTIEDIDNYYEMRIKKIVEFFERNMDVYFYGAGRLGKRCLEELRRFGKCPKGFVVSEKEEDDFCCDIPIYTLDEIKSDDVGIVITASKKNAEEMESALMERKIGNYIRYWA